MCGGAKALANVGRRAEATYYAEESKGLNSALMAIAAFCEVLYWNQASPVKICPYAVAATYTTTNLTTFKAIAKKGVLEDLGTA